MFKEFDTKPIACASIAQVHRAVTHDGKEVAVKIQHPNLISQAAGDVWLLQTASSLVGRLFPGHGYDWLLPEFESTMAMEVGVIGGYRGGWGGTATHHGVWFLKASD